MKDNQVWVLIDLPPNGQTIGSKWIFKKKNDMDGNVHSFKARLVAKGYTQTYSVDYGETFSPVADIRAINILFCHSRPKGFVDPKHSNKVCKLQCSIYELKQASRSWIKRFDVEIKKISFTQNPDEPRVYLKASGSNVAFLILENPKELLDGKLQEGVDVSLCDPATFQRCMTTIFHDMVEDFMEVFMDDFSVFGNSFDCCLANLDRMLTRCKETNLVLNWEKCHFMVKERIVLGHKISGAGIEVDRAKIDVIAKLV
ncbi:retrotransposon protein, putative, ty1-copia subclass [Tanacetum coccineum]